MRKSIVIGLVAALALAELGCSAGDDDDAGDAGMEAAPAAEESAEAASAAVAGGGSGRLQPSQGRLGTAVGPSIVQRRPSRSRSCNEFESAIQRLDDRHRQRRRQLRRLAGSAVW
jgi:hypothetical protein